MRAWIASASMRTSPTACLELRLCHSSESFHARTASSQPGAEATPGMATTSSPETTSGQVSRSLLGALSRRRRCPAPSCCVRRGGLLGGECERRAQGASSRCATGRSARGPRGGRRRTRARRARRRRDRPHFVPSLDASSSTSVRSSASREPRALLGQREQILLGARVESAQEREDLVPDEPALRARVRRVGSECESVVLAVADGVVSPDLQ